MSMTRRDKTMTITSVEAFRTSDGMLHQSEGEAYAHENDLEVVRNLQELFDDKASYEFGPGDMWTAEILIENRHALRKILTGGKDVRLNLALETCGEGS